MFFFAKNSILFFVVVKAKNINIKWTRTLWSRILRHVLFISRLQVCVCYILMIIFVFSTYFLRCFINWLENSWQKLYVFVVIDVGASKNVKLKLSFIGIIKLLIAKNSSFFYCTKGERVIIVPLSFKGTYFSYEVIVMRDEESKNKFKYFFVLFCISVWSDKYGGRERLTVHFERIERRNRKLHSEITIWNRKPGGKELFYFRYLKIYIWRNCWRILLYNFFSLLN